MITLEPETERENNELADLCIRAINKYGGHAKIAVKNYNFCAYVERNAIDVLIKCYARKGNLEEKDKDLRLRIAMDLIRKHPQLSDEIILSQVNDITERLINDKHPRRTNPGVYPC